MGILTAKPKNIKNQKINKRGSKKKELK